MKQSNQLASLGAGLLTVCLVGYALILLRTVTIALFEAAGFAVGWYTLLVNGVGMQQGIFPRRLALVGMLLGVLYIVDTFLPDTFFTI